ncbi:MAG TPA: hypothetical protein VE258_11930 [Ktedonobacterales bacterium]|nr:hypothetical protein [Ktedonobacterales bacterium]
MPTLREVLRFDAVAIAEHPRFVLTVTVRAGRLGRLFRRYTVRVAVDRAALPQATRVFRRLEDVQRYIGYGTLLWDLEWWPVDDDDSAVG